MPRAAQDSSARLDRLPPQRVPKRRALLLQTLDRVPLHATPAAVLRRLIYEAKWPTAADPFVHTKAAWIAERMGRGPRTVERALRYLKREGLIRVQPRSARAKGGRISSRVYIQVRRINEYASGDPLQTYRPTADCRLPPPAEQRKLALMGGVAEAPEVLVGNLEPPGVAEPLARPEGGGVEFVQNPPDDGREILPDEDLPEDIRRMLKSGRRKAIAERKKQRLRAEQQADELHAHLWGKSGAK